MVQETIKILATKDEVQAIAADLKIVKAAVTVTNLDVADHEATLRRLERV